MSALFEICFFIIYIPRHEWNRFDKKGKYSPGYEMKSFLETLRAIPCDLDWPRP